MVQCTCGNGWTDEYCPRHGVYGGVGIEGPDSPTARHHTEKLRAGNKEMTEALKTLAKKESTWKHQEELHQELRLKDASDYRAKIDHVKAEREQLRKLLQEFRKDVEAAYHGDYGVGELEEGLKDSWLDLHITYQRVVALLDG